MVEELKNEDGLYPCCADLTNRVPGGIIGPGISFELCSSCDRRHIEMEVDVGELGILLP